MPPVGFTELSKARVGIAQRAKWWVTDDVVTVTSCCRRQGSMLWNQRTFLVMGMAKCSVCLTGESEERWVWGSANWHLVPLRKVSSTTPSWHSELLKGWQDQVASLSRGLQGKTESNPGWILAHCKSCSQWLRNQLYCMLGKDCHLWRKFVIGDFAYMVSGQAVVLFLCGVFFLSMPCGLWDLSSRTRDRTRAPCSRSSES